jgi:large subunit ribosomal protein L18
MTTQRKAQIRKKRAMRVRKSLRGTATKPRLCVVKTNKHLQAQLIDDDKGITIAGLATNSKEMQGSKKNKETARKMGERMAAMAKEKKVETVVFDRGAHKYHGLLAELAEGARAAGLQF